MNIVILYLGAHPSSSPKSSYFFLSFRINFSLNKGIKIIFKQFYNYFIVFFNKIKAFYDNINNYILN